MQNIEVINKLLINELSAIETYQQALEHLRKTVDIAEADELMPIYEAHKTASTSLQTHILELAGTPAKNSGAWGIWAKIILGGANLLGKESILKALHEGEVNGEMNFQEALRDSELVADIRTLINTKLLPAQQEHIRTLDKMLESSTA